METLNSIDGRYSIFGNPATSKCAHIVEYAGEAPRVIVNHIEVPFEFLSMFIEKMSINTAVSSV
jgi:hypothetical protein